MRRLTRNEDAAMIGGVAAGIADYFDVDPVIVRLAFVLAAFAQGLGLLAYAICWIVIPTRGSAPGGPGVDPPTGTTPPADPSPVADQARRAGEAVGQAAREAGEAARRAAAEISSVADDPGRGRVVAGIALIAAGAFLLLKRFDWIWVPNWVSFGNLWPLLLVALGAALLLDALRKKTA